MDIKNLLASFNAHKVIYVVIGAGAFPIYGYDRATQDVDLCIKPTPANAKRAIAALEALGYDLMGLSLENFLTKKTLFRQYALDTDIHPFVAGITFDRLWKNRVSYTWEGVSVFFPELDDMILMKEAAGRPKDLEDLRYLKKIRAIRLEEAQKKSRKKSKKKIGR